ncbi:MAG: hypothetical protein K6B41_03510 [Butyrivibrio sp.]|nr:hypothetical protein [Butyrivibrio sp.]
MRVYKKNKCIKLLETLDKANGDILSDIQKGDNSGAAVLIGKCQQAAISVAKILEESAEEGVEAIRGLTVYCEKLFQLNNDLNSNSSININGIEKKLSKNINHTINRIKYDIKSETQILFLPYKASMWDSFETLWEKLCKDENSNVVVMPIPYFDKNSDGSIKEMHYEIDQYPKNVPVVSFEDYDFEINHPEKIYIHNPYDDMNYVTSVHPFFYSENMKKFTDELIYIPYFVLPEPKDPNDKEYLERNKHYFINPAVRNADRVIVQSENMKIAYVNVLTEYFGTDTKSIWERKIEGTGSPKLERVKNLKEADFDIPKDWMDKIYKKDGSKRKVVFYNIGVQPLLNNNMDMILKIKDTLKVFDEYKEEVTLLWRPHPLMMATLTSMRMDLWEEYKKIVDSYIEEDFGIYDDSADLDRAIAISDAYYGDWSSVVTLYKETGKPIMIHNCNILTED